MKKINVIAAISILLISVSYFQCKTSSTGGDPRGENYAGAKSCMKCHSNIYSSYLHTAHYVASIPADLKTVHGSFNTNNTFYLTPTQKVVMEQRDSGLFQIYYVNGKIKESHKFDIVMGGIKGESYLYWRGNALNQLPISYFTNDHKWFLSPRFDPRFINFNRSINSRCMECHASYIGDQSSNDPGLTSAELFDKNSLVFSVDCERCHGPGAQHVDFQTNHPEIKEGRYITSYNSLPRARKMDMCGTCHSGNKSEVLKPTFGFKPGDTLANYKLPGFETENLSGAIDVHGNQMQLLEKSKCFINTNMDCATCHNVHQNERNNIALYTQKCLNCHKSINHSFLKNIKELGNSFIQANCIKCHMPALASAAIISATLNKSVSEDILVHTHFITVYPNESKKILEMLAKNQHK